MKYKIVREESTKDMMETVQALLDDGWDLYGDLLIEVNSIGRPVYFREMVKHETDEDTLVWELPITKAEETIHAN